MWPKKPVRNTHEYMTGRTKTQFRTSVALCCLDKTRRFLLWTCPPTSVLHIPISSEIASGVPEICDFTNWLSFFVFLSSYFSSSFPTLNRNCYKTRTPYPIALKLGTQTYNGACWYQLWLEYDKQAKSYERLFTKNNTNMLSRLQGKLRMGRS